MLGKKRWRYHQLAVAQNLYLVEQSKAKEHDHIERERRWWTLVNDMDITGQPCISEIQLWFFPTCLCVYIYYILGLNVINECDMSYDK